MIGANIRICDMVADCAVVRAHEFGSRLCRAAKSISWRQHHDILSLAVSEANDVAITQLHKSTSLHLLAVQLRSVRAVEINEIRLHPPTLVTILVSASQIPKLNHSVLLRYAGMFQ